MNNTTTPPTRNGKSEHPAAPPADALIEQAAAHFANHNHAEALAALEEALAADPTRVETVLFQGTVLFHMGRVSDASARFHEATQMAPNNIQAQRSLAASLSEDGRLEEAERAIRAVLQLAPEDPQATRFLAVLLSRREQFAQAADLCQRILRTTPTDRETWLLLGRSSFELKDFRTATLAYETVLKLDPTHELARRNLELVRQSAPIAPPAPNRCRGLIDEIAADDEMFTGNRDHYFGVGRSALHCVLSILNLLQRQPREIHTILDLPCGHGRVLRSLKETFPNARLIACDLNKRGVDFCARTFGAQPLYSHENPRRIPFTDKYDLIWCGSLLTHLASASCSEFVRVFADLLKPGGLALVSLHGRWVAENLRTGRHKYCLDDESVARLLAAYQADGFGYVDYPGRQGYGISLSSPAYVLANWLSRPDLKLVNYTEKAWDNHQDVVCLQKLRADEPQMGR